MTAERIELTTAEIDAAAAVVEVPGGMGFHDRRRLVKAVTDAVNKRRAEAGVSRSLARDLRRLTESNTPYDDQARDLLGSYDIRPKP